MSPRDLITWSRLEIRRLVSPYPSLFLPLMRRRRSHDGHVIDDSTEIMIEGAPRSGNTFAVAAFEHAQGRPVSIARHLHGAGHVIEGIRRGVPILVVCRDPRDSITSQVIRHPETTLQQALRQWITFHEPLLEHIDQFVVGSFEEVTTDFGAVIARVNERFGTPFTTFEHTEENVASVFARVDEMDRLDRGRRAAESGATTARPVGSREALKVEVQSQLETSKMQTTLLRAARIHDQFTGMNARSEA
jgi:hypothetical protein